MVTDSTRQTPIFRSVHNELSLFDFPLRTERAFSRETTRVMFDKACGHIVFVFQYVVSCFRICSQSVIGAWLPLASNAASNSLLINAYSIARAFLFAATLASERTKTGLFLPNHPSVGLLA